MAINNEALSASTIAAIAATGRICLVSDIDGTLILEDSPEQPGLAELAAFLSEHRSLFLFAVATGRNLEQTMEVLAISGLPRPDVIIASVGAEIFHGGIAIADAEWSEHIGAGWNARQLVALEGTAPGLRLQEQNRQRPHKVSFYVDPEIFCEDRLVAVLKAAKLDATAVYSRRKFLDFLPPAASKGKALHYLCRKYSIATDRTIAFGDSGNDRDMLLAAGHAVVVGNRSPELNSLKDKPGIFFSEAIGAAGVLEGIRHSLKSIAQA